MSIADQPRSGNVIVGVDTHADVHVAVAISGLGARLDDLAFTPDPAGFASVTTWAASLGTVLAWGVEGTGSYGAGIARHLTRTGAVVFEVNRPNRALRRRVGKTDTIDAEAAARSVLSGTATALAKTGDGPIEAIRVTRLVKRSAVKARTQAINQLKALIVTAPDGLRRDLTGLTNPRLIDRCARLRPTDNLHDPATATKRGLRRLARRIQVLTDEIDDLDTELAALVTAAAPKLLDQFGIGPDSAAALLIAAGDNPHRLHSEAAVAALCGVNPIPVASGNADYHRLNRSGDRQANAALYRAVLTRLAYDPDTQAYIAARLAPGGGNKKHLIRKLKRYLARQLYPIILDALTPPATAHAA